MPTLPRNKFIPGEYMTAKNRANDDLVYASRFINPMAITSIILHQGRIARLDLLPISVSTAHVNLDLQPISRTEYETIAEFDLCPIVVYKEVGWHINRGGIVIARSSDYAEYQPKPSTTPILDMLLKPFGL